jgi:hypothetical protein
MGRFHFLSASVAGRHIAARLFRRLACLLLLLLLVLVLLLLMLVLVSLLAGNNCDMFNFNWDCGL